MMTLQQRDLGPVLQVALLESILKWNNWTQVLDTIYIKMLIWTQAATSSLPETSCE